MKRRLHRAYDRRLSDRLAKIRARKNWMRLHNKALRRELDRALKPSFFDGLIKSGVIVRVE